MNNFNNKLTQALKEWFEPAIDHHIENGITSDTFIEILKHIRDHYTPLLQDETKTINKYLQHIGYTPGEDPNRTPQEQETLTRLHDIPRILTMLFWGWENLSTYSVRFSKDPQTRKNSHAQGLLQFRRITNTTKTNAKRIQNIIKEITQTLTQQNYHTHETPLNNINTHINNLIQDLHKTHTYLSQDINGNTPTYDTKELLQTPETQWLPYLTPEQTLQIANQHPNHGPQEALNKITSITNYGPDHNQAAEILKLLTQYWNITTQDLLNNTTPYDPPELTQWINQHAHEYGIK